MTVAKWMIPMLVLKGRTADALLTRLSKAIISFLPQSAADWELFEVFHRAIAIESSGRESG